MNEEDKYTLISRNTAEIISEEELKEIIKTKEKPAMYLGTSITGRPHTGYFAWIQKLSDFLKAGWKVKLLFADIHGLLDNTPWELLEKRSEYYKIVIQESIKSFGANLDDFEIITGSDYQLSKEYTLDLLKLSSFTTLRNCNKAASDVVKLGDNPKLAGMIYPLMQALDEEYLKVDLQLGATDQRKIMMLAREYLPKLKYKSRVEMMIPFVRGLTEEGKMSSSVDASKIDLLDDEKTIMKKLRSAYCPEGDLQNGVMDYALTVIMTMKQDKNEPLVIERPEKFGGNMEFDDAEELAEAFQNKVLHPLDLKNAVAKEINKLLEPVRQAMKGQEKLIEEAYP